MRILVVEDDKEIQELITYFLIKEGYEVDRASDGLEGLKLLKENKNELVVLDLMLPNLDGKNFTKIVRDISSEYGEPVIIMLTAKTEIEDVLDGLEIGADDYMKKPFDPRELVLRIKKFLKTTDREIKNERYRFKDIEIDESRHIVIANGEEVELSKKEYDLLLLLVKNKDLVITRERILDKVWNSNYYTGDRTVDVYISKLRDKIPELSECIKTVKGVGYKLEEKR
ncbi:MULTISPECIES: response regulator transcription factor [Fusobacterium]|jgi:DNA-binding response OmpR family regulator|uniref:DNA-binding response regulator n=2 Tax=Fusobacterium varium TaxID=856 RepID=A0ABM6U4C4_FUSVA|nr:MULTISPECIES: response regulator transcription factor [Fusobacterium]AVQ31179.1 DNA-binding response regulator [Fusobacterium varium ATCC 27725]EES62493.1 alkaline phosphatase synthesis transcriptional regulatory protein PhoP [Fusobacterium varium ATCC 27725]MCF0171321.1 response regulator transcription factor [Fusobacterium varium]MCF2673230.1 response regulator transcription factor [Fusobacterium varium]MCI6031539.1 response regulator transcription factor [Fusobacterium varium]